MAVTSLPLEAEPATPPPLPVVRLDGGDTALHHELLAAVAGVASRGEFTLGPEVERFEQEFAAFCGVPHAVGVSSGTDALVLALRAVGVRRGDEVIVPANAFVAAAEAVCIAGATPRFVDVDEMTGNITAETVAPALRRRTRAIIAVHLYGRTVELEPLVGLARRSGIAVVEDACQAHGAWYHDARAGTIGDCGCFSFYPSKNLGGWGDGGAVVTGRDDIADTVRMLRSHGERARHHHVLVGTTARLPAIQAAVLRVKLRRLETWNDARRRMAAALSGALRGTSVMPPVPVAPGQDHVHHLYVVRTSRREALRRHLGQHGIGTAVHYPVPMHHMEAFRGLAARHGRLPAAERLANTVCTLPLSPWTVPADVERIAAAVREHDRRTRRRRGAS